MGMSLVPRNGREGVEYNWSGWRFVREFADTHGVDTSEFAGLNDGDEISEATCNAMATAIELHSAEYNEAFAGESYGPDPATEHAKQWRESGGFQQW